MVKYEIQKGKDQPVKFIAGLLLGLVLVPFGAYLYFTGGSAPVATTDSDMPFETFFAHKALNARIAKDMPKSVPIQPTEPNYLAGAENGDCDGDVSASSTAFSGQGCH